MAPPHELAGLEQEEEDEEELPVVSLSRHVSGAPARDSFVLRMPDARELAAQRKLEDEMEAELKKYELPEPLSIEEDPLIPDIKLPPTRKIKVTKSVENPGIVLEKLNKMDVIDKFDGQRAMFLSDLLEPVHNLEETLSWFSDSIENSIVNDKANFTSKDVHCLVLACSLMLLDERHRNNVSLCKIRSYVSELLNDVGEMHQSDEFLTMLAEHLLRVIVNCHNRVMLAQTFECCYIEPHNVRDPANFSNRLAMTIAFSSLKEILGIMNKNILIESLSMMDLKDVVVSGASWKDLNAQEQYSALMFMNMLKKYTESDESSDLAAVEEVLKFLAKFKFHDFKVKMLITKMNLFWQVRDMKEKHNKRKDKMEISDVMD